MCRPGTVKLLPPAGLVPEEVAPSPQSIVARRQIVDFDVADPLATVVFTSVPSTPEIARPVTVSDGGGAAAAAVAVSASRARASRITTRR